MNMAYPMTKKTNTQDYSTGKPMVILKAWHNYCMTSLIFRILVKLKLRR